MEVPSVTPILDFKVWNRWRGRAFISKSASWSKVWTWLTVMRPFWTRSRTKRRSISMCFIRVCCTGFKLKWVAPMLSQKNWGGFGRCKPSSVIKEWSQTVSEVAVANAWNSAYVEERDTALCLRADQEMGLEPGKVINAVVETLVSVLAAQSASTKVHRFKGLICWIRIPWNIVCLRYLRIRLAAV